MSKKKKGTVSPEAAKILEQYRNAGKPQPLAGTEGGASPSPDGVAPAQPRTPPPPGNRVQRRSGTRGK